MDTFLYFETILKLLNFEGSIIPKSLIKDAGAMNRHSKVIKWETSWSSAYYAFKVGRQKSTLRLLGRSFQIDST